MLDIHIGHFDGSYHGFNGVTLPGPAAAYLQMFLILLNMSLYIPKLLFDYTLSSIELLYETLSYHVRYFRKKPATFEGNKFIVLGANSSFGRSFSELVVKMNGSVVCVDSDKESGESQVKALNTDFETPRAFFYQFDLHNGVEVKQVVDLIDRDHQERFVLIVAAEYKSLVSTYFEVYKYVLKVMQKNLKGKLVFIRTLDKGPRDAIMALYSQVSEELSEVRINDVSTVIAHIYPNMGTDEADRNGIFGCAKPEEVARTILEGIAMDRSVIYMPGFMNYIGFYLKFLPYSVSQSIEGLLFEDKRKALSRQAPKNASVL